MRPTTRLPWVGKGSEALNEGIYHHWQYRTQVFLSPCVHVPVRVPGILEKTVNQIGLFLFSLVNKGQVPSRVAAGCENSQNARALAD